MVRTAAHSFPQPPLRGSPSGRTDVATGAADVLVRRLVAEGSDLDGVLRVVGEWWASRYRVRTHRRGGRVRPGLIPEPAGAGRHEGSASPRVAQPTGGRCLHGGDAGSRTGRPPLRFAVARPGGHGLRRPRTGACLPARPDAARCSSTGIDSKLGDAVVISAVVMPSATMPTTDRDRDPHPFDAGDAAHDPVVHRDPIQRPGRRSRPWRHCDGAAPYDVRWTEEERSRLDAVHRSSSRGRSRRGFVGDRGLQPTIIRQRSPLRHC